MILITILVALAAILNAVMDRVEYGAAFRVSVFSRRNPRFWQKDVSWQYAKKVFGWKADAWHIAKSGMVVLLISAIVIAMFFPNPWLPYGADIILLGCVWNAVFNLFYHHILKR